MAGLGIAWDQALIEKYNYSGPRYTSYPTALEFNDGYDNNDFTHALSLYPSRPLSLYVHIPFCHKLCYYCGCNKVVTRHQEKADVYLDYLEREMRLRAPLVAGRKVSQMHWGGGTPTFLDAAQLKRLMSMLRAHFDFSDEAELGIEIDPREIELDTINLLRELGFNRLSLGVQDFDKAVQVAVNREQDEAFIFDLVARARHCGFASVNIDLIYGLPLQSEQSFAHTLKRVQALSPDRLSVFNYAHLPSRFAAQRKIDEAQLPSPSQRLAILRDTINTLCAQGYQFIGMDHFAKPDDELARAQRQGVLHRNFQGYTTQGDAELLGLGVSAISMFDRSYGQNQRELKHYYQQIDAQGHALFKGVKLSDDDALRREVIKSLICNFELDMTRIEKEFSINFARYFAEDLALLGTFVDDALLNIGDTHIVVSEKGRLLIRNICMCFDAYFRDQARRQQFSRVI